MTLEKVVSTTLYIFLTAMLIFENYVKAAGIWECNTHNLGQIGHQNMVSSPEKQRLYTGISI